VLALAAVDTWLLMIPRGGRYGAGGFNVAHFAWIDALFPVPTPRAYVGIDPRSAASSPPSAPPASCAAPACCC
jgi:hypothetical protein